MGIVYTNKNLTTNEKDFLWDEDLNTKALELNSEEKQMLDEGLVEPSVKTVQSILNYSKTTEFNSTQAGDFKGNKN